MTEMIGWLGAAAIWVKAAHVIFIIFWIAGLFIVPRYFVHHHETTPGSAEDRAWIEREKLAKKVILTPAMVISWLLGLSLAFNGGYFTEGWFHAKFLLVILLTGYQGWVSSVAKKLARGDRPYEGKALRLLNEVPGVFTILIVILAVVRPF
ncbi:CopD family protein [Sphingomicrobium sediminis]|uniref:Protoporphyrinogen IX oxidase n=1 Tax=Sphingomicrobium sediminis TaxID=2950949 RepID=A0A9X2EIC2_9SPHN|nr:CopD family protein [Sphingomicrobium sediminis]MCM8558082.1 CopD family protein [Sphingomicrobium sediminis]